MDGNIFSIVDPARVRAVFVPIGRVKRSRFLDFLDRFKHEDVVQLRDVSPDHRPHTTMFSPLAFPAGRVLYDLRTSVPPAAHLALSPLEIYRQPFIVVAVADGQQYHQASTIADRGAKEVDNDALVDDISEQAIESLLQSKEHLASEFSSALVHQVILFDSDVSNQRLPSGITALPSRAKSKTTTVKTVMCDLTSQLLAEMPSLARSLQDLASVESPKVARQSMQRPLARYLDSSRPASADPTQQMLDGERSEHRMSMPAHLLANLGSRSSTPEARSMSQTNINGTLSSPSSPPSRPVDLPRPMSRDRASLQGFGSNSLSEKERGKHRGRMNVITGSLYLLAGRWPDAVKEISEGAAIAKANNDHMWHAKALDYLLLICLLYAWAGLDFRIPQALYGATEKPGSGSIKSTKDTASSSHAEINHISKSTTRDSSLQSISNMLPELLTTIQNLYSRAWTFSEDRLPQLSFSESGLRYAKLLTVVEPSNGRLTDGNLKQIVLNLPFQPDTATATQITIFPSKAEITTFLFRSFPAPGIDDSLTVADRTRILAGIASILGELGYHRKKAHVLKELLEGLVPALVEARKRGAAEMGVHPAASLASLDAALTGARHVGLRVPNGEDESGIQSFLGSVCNAYEVGIEEEGSTPPASESNTRDASGGNQTPTTAHSEQTETIIQRAVHQAFLKRLGSLELKSDVLRLCISVCEALPDLEGILRYSAELLRTSGSGIAPGPEDNNGSAALSIDDQLRLWNNISRTVGAARQLGLVHLAADYWDEFLVRGIEFVPSTSNSPTPRARDDLESVAESNQSANKGPFLYNPFSKVSPAKTPKPLAIAGEEATFRVTLQNLYDFDLEIESIRLVSDQDDHDASAQSPIIGPYRTQSIYLSTIWPDSGPRNIIGCIAKIRGCHQRWFPLFDQPWSPRLDVKSSQSPPSELRSEKFAKTADSTQTKKSRAHQTPVPASVALDIIPPLPHIVLKKISLPLASIMLLEGETKTFNLTLFNTSKSVTADLLLLTFEDSTATQLRAAMSNKELSPSDLFELESAATKQSLKWLRQADESPPIIGTEQEFTLKVAITGKPGLSDANILISYAHLGVPRSELKERFYTRQLSIPLTVTVNASIDLIRTELLPFTPSFAWQNQQQLQNKHPSPPSTTASEPSTKSRRPSSMSTRSKSHRAANNENRFQALLSRIGLSPDDKSHCLLCLDCRNSWPTPLSISIQVRSSPSPSSSSPPSTATTTPPPNNPTSDYSSLNKLTYTVHESLQPGQTKRILLLLPRVRLPKPHAPIPSLAASSSSATKKQFVLPADSSTETRNAQLAARERFWYREAVLAQLQGTWTEESTGRSGAINLRKMKLEGVEALRAAEVEVEMGVEVAAMSFFLPSETDDDEDDGGGEGDHHHHHHHQKVVERISNSTFLVPLSTPLTLTARVTNYTPHPIHPLLRLLPSSLATAATTTSSSNPSSIDYTYPDPGPKFLVHGLLQQVLPVLAPGEGRDVEVGITVLGRGRWSVGGVVEEVRVLEREREGGRREMGDGDGNGGAEEDWGIKREGRRERRVWGVEEGCVLVGRMK
ncbi:MAG: hypothetical protein Q9219_001519 [cf. Caloplaca sp. 3 TL-2023]